MNFDHDARLFVSGHLLLAAVLGFVVFHSSFTPPLVVGYGLLAMFYFYPLFVALLSPVDKKLHIFFLLFTTGFTMLIIIDPVEMGLYGGDVYSTSLPAHELLLKGTPIPTFISRSGASWPAFYSLTVILERLGFPRMLLAKYVPLIAATAPVMCYIALDKRLPSRTAFVVSIGFASTRTLLSFETKFVDETLAVTLVFVALVVLMAPLVNRKKRTMFVIVYGTISLTHHVITVLFTLLLAIWVLANSLRKLSTDVAGFLSRFVPYLRKEYNFRYAVSVVLVTVITVGIFIYAVPNLTSSLILSVVGVFIDTGTTGVQSPGSVAADSGIRSTVAADSGIRSTVAADSGIRSIVAADSGIRSTVASSALHLFVVLAIIDAYVIFYSKRVPVWITSWIVFAGVVSILYASYFVFGQVISLDPIRFLIVLVPTLLAPAIYCVHREIEPQRRKSIVAVSLVGLLIITQLAAIELFILYSQPSITEPDSSDNHHTPKQFATSEWIKKNVPLEQEYTSEYVSPSEGECGENYIYNWETLRNGSFLDNNNIYSTGGTAVYTCR